MDVAGKEASLCIMCMEARTVLSKNAPIVDDEARENHSVR